MEITGELGLDWLIVVVLNASIVAYGLYLAPGTTTSREWFLGSRALPWWAVGMSMFATNVDSSDLVSVTGATCSEGLHIITVYAFGSAVAGVLVAFFVVPAMYRAGHYTNAEYLESRFGPTARIVSALIQIQYRTSVLGLMIWATFLMFTSVLEMDPTWAWTVIVSMVAFSAAYTAWGGLRTVVITDALQGLVIMLGVLVAVVVVWNEVGGWHEMVAALNAMDDLPASSAAPADLAHVGRFRGSDGNTSPYVVALGWVIIAGGYWTVNHTQTMRLMGSRSLWDLRAGALFGVALSLPVMLAAASLGLFGRVLLPDLQNADEMYPQIVSQYLAPGLKGLVVAGLFAAVVSTFDSMGSALSAVFTRDIYARLIVRDRPDAHYVWVGRLATVGILSLGFVYLPFIASKATMIQAFRSLVSVFVTPLFTTYLIGVFTRAPRHAGIVGLLAGAGYGVVAFVDRETQLLEGFLGSPDQLAGLPVWFTGQWAAFAWSMAFTALGALAASLIPARTPIAGSQPPTSTGWLERSTEALPELREHPFRDKVPIGCEPRWYAVALVAITAYLTFVFFW